MVVAGDEAAVLARAVVVRVGLGALLELGLGRDDVPQRGDRGRLVGREASCQEVRDRDGRDDGDDRDDDHQLDESEARVSASHGRWPFWADTPRRGPLSVEYPATLKPPSILVCPPGPKDSLPGKQRGRGTCRGPGAGPDGRARIA